MSRVLKNRYGKKYGLTAMFPIANAASTESLRVHLRSMDRHPFGSPFADVSAIHLARFIILDRLPYQGFPAKTEQLTINQLIFMCDFDGDSIDDLAATGAAHARKAIFEIWRHCREFPFSSVEELGSHDGGVRLARYFARFEVDTMLYLSDWPDATVPEILRAIQVQAAFSEFVASHQLDAARELKQQFLKLWKSMSKKGQPQPGSL